MSHVVAGVAASHTTLMNTKWDEVDHLDRAHRYRNALGDARQLLVDRDVDVAVIVGSNHFRGFWLDLMPAFTIGVGDVIGAGEHGTPEGPQPIDVELAGLLYEGLLDRDFDPAQSAKLTVDHGITHAVQYIVPPGCAIVPVVVNCFAKPLPSPRRCAALGAALGGIIAGDGLDRRVAVIGSGGLSHQLPFPDWRHPRSDDDEYLVGSWTEGRGRWAEFEPRRRAIITSAPAQLAETFDADVLAHVEHGTVDELAGRSGDDLEADGGNGAHEVRCWIAMAAACGWAPGRALAYSAMPEWLTGMAVVAIDQPAAATTNAPRR